jgi:phosphatidylglycerophosphatase A
MAIPGYLILQHLSTPLYLAVLAIAFVAGIWICDVTEKAIGIPDYPGIVWDEIVGYWVTMFLVPPGWQWLFLGFILFRFFDILKPWPISWLNKNVHGGFGVMVDDLLAAVISFLVLHLIMYFIA